MRSSKYKTCLIPTRFSTRCRPRHIAKTQVSPGATQKTGGFLFKVNPDYLAASHLPVDTFESGSFHSTEPACPMGSSVLKKRMRTNLGSSKDFPLPPSIDDLWLSLELNKVNRLNRFPIRSTSVKSFSLQL